MAHAKSITALTFALLFASTASSKTLVFDSFESGDMSAPNADGFQWAPNNRTSVVTMESGIPYVIYNNGLIHNQGPAGSDWTAHNGSYSLRFRYPVGENWAEQRFSLSNAYPEIWMSFWLRVPTNYTAPTRAPDNEKLFRLWMDAYEDQGVGSTVGMSFRANVNGDGGSYFFAKVSSGNKTPVGGDTQPAPFIKVPDDRGKWMKLVVHVKSESVPGASDGIMEVWRKWEDETHFTETQDLKNLPIKLDSTGGGFKAGYLMGWANAPYSQTTQFLIDSFTLSTDSLLNRPNPPKVNNVTINQ